MNLVSILGLILQTFKQMGSSARARKHTKQSLIQESYSREVAQNRLK